MSPVLLAKIGTRPTFKLWKVSLSCNFEFSALGMLCAGHEASLRDSCVGDSGGALVKNFDVDGDDAYYQVGVVSFGFECAKPKEPGIYTRMTSYTKWMYRQVSKLLPTVIYRNKIPY